MRFIVALISSALVAAPALAQTSGGVMSGSGAELSDSRDAPESTSDAGEAAAERMICRRIEAVSGSRLSTRRVCRTAEQWRAAQRSN
jgi:hypothetical protein